MTQRKASIILVGMLLAVQVFFVNKVAAEEGTADSKTVERLERVIEEQQQQLDSLQQQLNELKQTTTEAQTQAKEAKPAAEEVKATAQPPVEKTVTSGQERVKLAISGQVNRAVNFANDGTSTETYFVDSDASNTRVRFIGTAKATDDLTLGTKIEIGVTSNESSEVSQVNRDSGNFFDVRWAQVSLDSERFGMISLGKGDTASNNSAEVDLSKTNVVQYASIGDIAAGLLFRRKSDDALTDVRINDSFRNQDGKGRRDRARYDTPKFHGCYFAGSLVTDERWDLAFWFGLKGSGFKAAGAAAVSYRVFQDTGYLYNGSFSVLHEATGLNFTLSASLLEQDNQGNPVNLYVKAGWLARFFSLGTTALGVDFTRQENLPTDTDDGYSISGAVVQQFEDYGAELYLQYRVYSLNRDVAPSVYDINVGTIGARVKF